MTTDVSFEVTEIEHGGTPVLEVRGELDVSTAPELRDRLVDLCERGCTLVIVDLTDVSFLDSTALGVLVSALKRLQDAGGDLQLVIAHPHVLKVFEITGLLDVFTVHPELQPTTVAL
jgi:anti-sigma B factor antagonist